MKQGTVLALRAAEVATHAQERNKWWMVEQPHHREGKPSMWLLDEFVWLIAQPGVYILTFSQCKFGCRAQKDTDLLTNIPNLEHLAVLCDYPCRTWVIPWSGKRVWAPHPPLRGRQWAIPVEDWDPSMLEPREPKGDYITRSMAAYPAELNKVLAEALSKPKRCEVSHAQRSTIGEADYDVGILRLVPMKGQQDEKKKDDETNSFRNIHKWVNSKARYIGVQVANLITKAFMEEPAVEKQILDPLGTESETNDAWLNSPVVQKLRAQVLDLLARNRSKDMPSTCSLSEIDEDGYKTCVRGHLLRYWAQVVADPAKDCARWLFQGAPAGLECDTMELEGIFPSVDQKEMEYNVGDLVTDSFANYAGIEDDDEAFAALEKYHRAGYLGKRNTLRDAAAAVGGHLVQVGMHQEGQAQCHHGGDGLQVQDHPGLQAIPSLQNCATSSQSCPTKSYRCNTFSSRTDGIKQCHFDGVCVT